MYKWAWSNFSGKKHFFDHFRPFSNFMYSMYQNEFMNFPAMGAQNFNENSSDIVVKFCQTGFGVANLPSNGPGFTQRVLLWVNFWVSVILQDKILTVFVFVSDPFRFFYNLKIILCKKSGWTLDEEKALTTHWACTPARPRATTPFGNFILTNPRATSGNFAPWRKNILEKTVKIGPKNGAK